MFLPGMFLSLWGALFATCAPLRSLSKEDFWSLGQGGALQPPTSCCPMLLSHEWAEYLSPGYCASAGHSQAFSLMDLNTVTSKCPTKKLVLRPCLSLQALELTASLPVSPMVPSGARKPAAVHNWDLLRLDSWCFAPVWTLTEELARAMLKSSCSLNYILYSEFL